jgi:PAP2 superfamily
MGSVEGALTGSRSLPERVWRRISRRGDGRAPLWIELTVIAWLFYLYDVVNDFAPIRQRLATHNATGLITLEHSLRLDPEHALNAWLAGQALLGSIASYYYFFAHGVITITVLALLWWKRPALYRRQRTLLVIINLIAFVVFWRYPLAPPRMFPRLGFTDVIATSHALVSWSSGALVHDADQLAAMPSLHIAWAIWSGTSLWLLLRRRIVAIAAIVYPVITAMVVMGTGNHYLLDVLAGASTVPIAYALRAGIELLAERAPPLLRVPVALPRGAVLSAANAADGSPLVAAVADPFEAPAGAAEAEREQEIAEETRAPGRRFSPAQAPRGVRESA